MVALTLSHSSAYIMTQDELLIGNSNSMTTPLKVMKPSHPPSVKKIVNFFPLVEVSIHIRICDYSESERRSCWYSRQEYESIRDEIKLTVDLMDEEEDGKIFIDGNDHDDHLCTRGLESLTKFGRVLRSFYRSQTKNAVLDEQYLQYDECRYDPEVIAKVSLAESERAQTAAQNKAIKDAKTSSITTKEQPPTDYDADDECYGDCLGSKPSRFDYKTSDLFTSSQSIQNHIRFKACKMSSRAA